MAQFDKLFEPLKIRNVVIRNRIVSTGHAEVYSEGVFRPSGRSDITREGARRHRPDDLRRLLVGLIDSPSAAWNGLDVSHDRIVPHLSRFAEAVHEHGAALMIQLTHMGDEVADIQNWRTWCRPADWRAGAPVQLQNDGDRGYRADRARLRPGSAPLQEAGLDGAEISAAHQQPDRPVLVAPDNKRADRYGAASRTASVRRAIFEEIRRVVATIRGGIRMCGDEFHPDGLDQAELLKIARFHAEHGLVDFIDVIGPAPTRMR